MDDTLLSASSRSLSPGSIPSETGSSVQVHADIGSTRTRSVTGTERSATPSVHTFNRIPVDAWRERLSRTRPPSPFVSSHGNEPPLRDDLLRDLIVSHDNLLFGTASVPLSHSLKRPHDGEPTDTEPLAKRDRLIEELDLMASSGSKGATESLQTKRNSIDDHHASATSHAEDKIPTLAGHARIILPIRTSTKRPTIEKQSTHSTEQHNHMERSSEDEDSRNPQA